jgi:hypothetical protein
MGNVIELPFNETPRTPQEMLERELWQVEADLLHVLDFEPVHLAHYREPGEGVMSISVTARRLRGILDKIESKALAGQMPYRQKKGPYHVR